MKEHGVVYLVTNLVNGKYYVGQTGKTLAKRWNQHLSDAKRGRGFHLHSAIKKYGKSEFVIEILASTPNKEVLNSLEVLWISLTRSYDPKVGYNKTFGGEGADHTQETRKKISNANKGLKRTDETRERMSVARIGMKLSDSHRAAIGKSKIGNKNCLGRVVSETTRQKQSEVAKLRPANPKAIEALRKSNIGNTYNVGKTLSEETKAKMSAAQKGKKKSPEHAAKIGIRSLGNTNWLGKTHSPETRAKLSILQSGRTVSPEVRKRLSELNKGKPWSEARREAQRLRQEMKKTAREQVAA